MSTQIKLRYQGKEPYQFKKGTWIKPGQCVKVNGEDFEPLLKKGFKVYRDPHGWSGETIENKAALDEPKKKKKSDKK